MDQGRNAIPYSRCALGHGDPHCRRHCLRDEVCGLTVDQHGLVAYYVVNGSDTAAISSFTDSVERARASLGNSATGIEHAIERLWAYGHGEGSVPYDQIRGVVSRPAADGNPAAHQVAQKLAQR